MTIIAAADGSALGNPGPAGWAWYIDDERWRAGGWPHGTNNQGELMAVLDLFRATAHLPTEKLRILCDSQYVINCVTKWMPGWKRKGWRKADGNAVLNVELLRQIDQQLIGRDYEFEWVKGHAGHHLNEAADLRARAAATAYQKNTEPEAGPGFPGQIEATVQTEAAVRSVQTSDSAERSRAMKDTLQAAPRQEYSEPDLFSSLVEELGDETAQELPESDPVRALQECDQSLFSVDPSEAAVLLAEDFEEITATGRIISRDAVLADHGSPNAASMLALTPLSASVDAELATLFYRVKTSSGTAIQTSLWRRSTGQWRLQLRQTTPELD
ncbi:ribonuclease HI family protein [Psychromicrobium lacuslunae]|uniref:ribonuclease H n=1 Tax=Psychromicrobium lacuslunae TaxID=1618207 RepID=A0A0D4C2R1_9MICC|nr:ribonuclease HI family protein [Psychromicrobium lacuslunae]AJT42641.1 hypothetical protein UM93_16290 [Psychromicrobium lacuslunae]